MEAYHLEQRESLGILHLHAGSANALNYQVMEALTSGLRQAVSSRLKGLVLTGYDRFFSAGLDLVTVYEFNRKEMSRFLEDFDAALKQLFGHPMPVVAAINGAATAGGCILALACDYRLMAAGSGIIGLNEIHLGLPLPATALQISRFSLPSLHQAYVLYSGRLFQPEEALAVGLLHEVVPPDQLLGSAFSRLQMFTEHPGNASITLKTALRGNALDRMTKSAGAVREAFLEAWFSPEARQRVGELRQQLLAKKQGKA